MPPTVYSTTRSLVTSLFKVFTRCEVRGIENVPDDGPLLVLSNHLSLADPPLLGVSLGRRVRFMAKKELFRFRLIASFLSSLGAFPVHRGRMDRQAIHRATKILSGDQALIIFPEGMRSHNAQLRRAFSGSALIAAHSNTPILPVGIIGTEKIKGLTWLFRRPKITVNIGQPFHLPSVDGKLTKEQLVELTNYMMEHIAVLIPKGYRGKYQV